MAKHKKQPQGLNLAAIAKAQDDLPGNTAAIRDKVEQRERIPSKKVGNGSARVRKSVRLTSEPEPTLLGDDEIKLLPGSGETNFDVSTREGRRQRLVYMVNHAVDSQARAAIADLNRMDAEDNETDPNAKVDPALVMAYLARAELNGVDPAKLLVDTHGIRKVLVALSNRLDLTYIKVVCDGDVVEVGELNSTISPDNEGG